MTWPAAIQSFRAYLQLERSMSHNTLDAYLGDVQKFVRYLEIEGIDRMPLQVGRNDLERFIHWVNKLGLEASSQARLISGLRAFYKFLLVEDLLDDDPTELLEGPRLRRKIPEILSVYEIRQMLDIIDLSEPQGQRNRAILETLYACGLRVSELVNLRRTNMFLAAGFIKVLGKNNKERLVPIGVAIGESLDLDRVLALICRESHALFQVNTALIWYKQEDELIARAAYGSDSAAYLEMRQPLRNNPLRPPRLPP